MGVAPAPTPALDVQNPVKKREAEQGQAGSEQDIRTGPQLLVNGEPEIPQFSRGHGGKAKTGQAQGFGPGVTL